MRHVDPSSTKWGRPSPPRRGGDSFFFPENLENRIPKSKLMKKLGREKEEAERTIGMLYDLMMQEPSIVIVACHDHRIPGRYELAPHYYEK